MEKGKASTTSQKGPAPQIRQDAAPIRTLVLFQNDKSLSIVPNGNRLEWASLKVLSIFAVLLFAQSKGESYGNADGITRSAVNAENRVVGRGDS